MKIEHIAMYVIDIEAEKDFFIRYFNGKTGKRYHNAKTGFISYFIDFDDGARIEVMTRPGMEDNTKPLNRTGYAHIAFSVGSREKVDRLTQRLHDDHYQVISGPRITGDGYYESCVIDPEGNQIEITI